VTPVSGPVVIEPFDPARHDRAGFSSGTDQVDNFLKKSANKLSKADNLRVFAMVDAAGALIGFYAMNAHAIDYTDLPARLARTRPGNGCIPAAFISMIGVDSRYQGRGYGGDLLVDCLSRILRASGEIGVAVVMLDILDCGDPVLVAKRTRLCQSYGFIALASNPLRLFLPLATFRALLQD